MNKIIPIICIICAVIGAAVSIVALILMSVAVSAHGVAIVSVPIAIIAGVFTLFSTATTVSFIKDKLCRIAFIIDGASLIIAAVALALWYTV